MTSGDLSVWLSRFGALVNSALAVCAVVIVIELWSVGSQLSKLNKGVEYVMEQDENITVIRDRLEKIEYNIARITRGLPK